MDLLREGASAREGEHAIAERVAQWVWDFTAPGYGPAGGWKLVEGELSKAADALRAVPGDPALAPYQELAADTRRHGHQAALAMLLASGTVRRALDSPKHVPAMLEGIDLARRQTSAWLAAHARAASPAEALADVDPLLPSALLEGLPHLVTGDSADLDRIAIHGADIEQAAWSPGIPIDTEGPAGPVGVLMVGDVTLPRPRTASSLKLSSAGAAADWEDAGIQALRARMQALGVGLLVCGKDVPEDLAARLAFDQVAVCRNAGKALMARIALATGARRSATLWTADADDVGAGTLTRRIRRGDHLLAGSGPTATLEVPGIGPAASLAEARAEAWLRTVGAVWEDPRVVSGGGAWQREAAASLRAMAPHAPGKASLGIEVVATVLDDVAVALLRNLGRDPSRERSVPGVADSYVCALASVRSGLDVAQKILRIDGRFRKRSSNPMDLRGNLGPSGSPKGMPGDIPPLM